MATLEPALPPEAASAPAEGAGDGHGSGLGLLPGRRMPSRDWLDRPCVPRRSYALLDLPVLGVVPAMARHARRRSGA